MADADSPNQVRPVSITVTSFPDGTAYQTLIDSNGVAWSRWFTCNSHEGWHWSEWATIPLPWDQ